MATLLQIHAQGVVQQYSSTLAKARRKSDVGRVHALRVALKQLRTLLRLAAFMAPNSLPPKRVIERLMTLFRAAGEQREARVSEAVVRRIQRSSTMARMHYLEILEHRARRSEKKLHKALQDIRQRDAEKLAGHFAAVSQGLTHTQEQHAAVRYIEHEMRSAKKHFKAGPPEATLHQVRKHLKNAWHCLRMLEHAGALDVERDALMHRMAAVQEALGDWHDLHVVSDDLETQVPAMIHGPLKELVDAELARKRRLVLKELPQVLTH
jgi:CHAD domain-containing protein